MERRKYEQLKVADPESFKSDPNRRRQIQAGTRPREKKDIYCLAVSPDGKRSFAGGGPVFTGIDREIWRESPVTMWEIATGRRVFKIGDKGGPILRFCLSPDGSALYTCGDKVLGWDAGRSGPPTQTFDASGRRMISVAVSPDGAMLAAGSLEGTVIVWHADTAAHLATLAHEGGPVYGLSFSPNSRKLVAAGERGVATNWDIEPPSRKR